MYECTKIWFYISVTLQAFFTSFFLTRHASMQTVKIDTAFMARSFFFLFFFFTEFTCARIQHSHGLFTKSTNIQCSFEMEFFGCFGRPNTIQLLPWKRSKVLSIFIHDTQSQPYTYDQTPSLIWLQTWPIILLSISLFCYSCSASTWIWTHTSRELWNFK